MSFFIYTHLKLEVTYFTVVCAPILNVLNPFLVLDLMQKNLPLHKQLAHSFLQLKWYFFDRICQHFSFGLDFVIIQLLSEVEFRSVRHQGPNYFLQGLKAGLQR